MENWSSTFTSSQPQFSGEYTCRNTATQNPMSTHLATTTSNCTQRKSRAVRNLQGGVTREGREEGGGGAGAGSADYLPCVLVRGKDDNPTLQLLHLVRGCDQRTLRADPRQSAVSDEGGGGFRERGRGRTGQHRV